MGSILSSPKLPFAPPAPVIPTAKEEAGSAAEARQKARLETRKRRGRASTILTGQKGAANLGAVKRPGADSDSLG